MTASAGALRPASRPEGWPGTLGWSDGPAAGAVIRVVEELVQRGVVHHAVENCFDLVEQPFARNEATRATRERLRREEGLREVRLEPPGASDAVAPIRIELGRVRIPPTVVSAQLAQQHARCCCHPAVPLAPQLRYGEP